jgi:AcrR family transcriptional regulator
MTKHRINRTLVIETAVQYVNQHGLAALTLAAIAQTLDIKLPSLYNHISGIEDMHATLAAYGAQALFRCCQDAAVGQSGDAALRTIANAYRDFIRQNPGIYAATLVQSTVPNAALAHANQDLMHLLTRVLQPYALTPHDTIHVLRGLRSIVHGFSTLEATGTFALPVDTNDSFQTVMQWFITSIASIPRI